MAGNIALAWALPVKTELLGARLEAYVKSKPIINMFKLCVKYGQLTGAPIGKLPQELVEMVAKKIHEPLLYDSTRRWANYQKCLDHVCMPSDHFDEPHLMEHLREAEYSIHESFSETDGYDSDVEDHLDEMSYELGCTHHEKLGAHLEKFNSSSSTLNSTNNFRRCKKIFASDFNLELYFIMQQQWDDDPPDKDLEEAAVLSYMILPSTHSEMKTTAGPGIVSYLSATIVNPSILQEPTDEQKTRFKTALSVLQLEPMVDNLQHFTEFPTSQAAPDEILADDSKAKDQNANEDQPAELTMNGAFGWPKLAILTSGTIDALPSEY